MNRWIKVSMCENINGWMNEYRIESRNELKKEKKEKRNKNKILRVQVKFWTDGEVVRACLILFHFLSWKEERIAVRAHTHTHTFTRTLTYTNIHTHTDTHTPSHTHTHTQTRPYVPVVTLPNTVCFRSNQGVGTVVMKNFEAKTIQTGSRHTTIERKERK